MLVRMHIHRQAALFVFSRASRSQRKRDLHLHVRNRELKPLLLHANACVLFPGSFCLRRVRKSIDLGWSLIRVNKFLKTRKENEGIISYSIIYFLIYKEYGGWKVFLEWICTHFYWYIIDFLSNYILKQFFQIISILQV